MNHDWLTFQWDLGAFSGGERAALPPFVFRRADSGEADAILRVVSSALMMERAWSGGQGTFGATLQKDCGTALESDPPAAVVVQHGARIIGASILRTAEDAESHLLTGPCILHEYRSRGLGSALLHDSLEFLRDSGLRTVRGIARVNSTAARFVYPKFGGTQEPQTSPRLAA